MTLACLATALRGFASGRTPPGCCRRTNNATRQLIEQRLGVFEDRRVKSFGEAAVDGREEIMGLRALALVAREAREACGGAQLQRSRGLISSHLGHTTLWLLKTRVAYIGISHGHRARRAHGGIGVPPACSGIEAVVVPRRCGGMSAGGVARLIRQRPRSTAQSTQESSALLGYPNRLSKFFTVDGCHLLPSLR
jgi:hypothetical protein